MPINFLTGKYIADKPRRKSKKLPEAKVGEEVDAYLKSIGAYLRTIKSDGRKLPNGKWIPSTQGRGISDRIGLLPGGRFLAIELKAPGRLRSATEEQIEFLRNIINLGGIGVVADSVECVRVALTQSREELLETLPKIKKEYLVTDECF